MVVIVVAIVIAAGILFVAMMKSASDEIEEEDIVIAVNDAHEEYFGWFLVEGNKYVVYDVTITNNKNSELHFSVYCFELHTSSGLVYSPSYSAGTPMTTPDSINSGGSYTFVLGFEIGESDSGVEIVYEWLWDDASAPTPL